MSENINSSSTLSTTSQIEFNIISNVAKSKLPILDGTYFEQVSSKSTDTKIVGICKRCVPNYVEIKGFKNCTSNFVTHLKRKHGNDVFEEYRTHMKRKKTSSTICGQSSTSRHCKSITS